MNLEEKMAEAYSLSNRFDYTEGFTDAEYELVSGWQDGLMHKYYQRHAYGRCSIQAMIDFDVAEFESRVDSDIRVMQGFLNRKVV